MRRRRARVVGPKHEAYYTHTPITRRLLHALTEPRPVKQAKRGLLPTLSATQIVEMQGILTASAAETKSRYFGMHIRS